MSTRSMEYPTPPIFVSNAMYLTKPFIAIQKTTNPKNMFVNIAVKYTNKPTDCDIISKVIITKIKLILVNLAASIFQAKRV